MASGSSRLSGLSSGTGRAALRMPPSITKWATWIPLGDSSRAIDWARPRNANLPMAKVAESAKPLTPAVAPDNRTAPSPLGSIRFTACCETRKAPNALISMARFTSSGGKSTSAPRTRLLAL